MRRFLRNQLAEDFLRRIVVQLGHLAEVRA